MAAVRHVVYSESFPFVVVTARGEEPRDLSVRIETLQATAPPNEASITYRVTDPTDPQFLLVKTVKESDYLGFKNERRIRVNWEDFPTMLIDELKVFKRGDQTAREGKPQLVLNETAVGGGTTQHLELQRVRRLNTTVIMELPLVKPSLSVHVAYLTEELGIAKREIEKHQENATAQHTKAESTEAQLHQLQAELSRRQAEWDDQKQALKLEQNQSVSNLEKSALEAKMVILAEHKTAVENVKTEHQTAIERLQQQIETLRKERDTARAQATQLKTERDHHEAELQKTRPATQAKHRLEVELATSTTEATSLRAQLETAQASLAELRKEAVTKATRIDSLAKKLDEREDFILFVKDKGKEFAKEAREYKTALEKTREELSKAREQASEAEKAKAEFESRAKDRNEVASDRDGLASKCDELTQKVKDLSQNVEDLESEREKHKQVIIQQKEEMETLQATFKKPRSIRYARTSERTESLTRRVPKPSIGPPRGYDSGPGKVISRSMPAPSIAPKDEPRAEHAYFNRR